MISFKQYVHLNEGGNVFKTNPTSRIQRSQVIPTVDFLSSIVGFDLSENLLGSTGKAESSGDIDIAVDQQNISKDELVTRLSDYAIKNGLDPREVVRKTGISVHFRSPIIGNEGEGVQVDFMFIDDIPYAQWVLSSNDEPPIKGLHRHLVMSALAKRQGLTWGGVQGLKNRETKQVITKDPSDISYLLLGANSTAEDLLSTSSIFRYLKTRFTPDEIRAMLEEAENGSVDKTGISLFNTFL